MFRWLGLALLGILVAAAVAIAASRLASQQIGLASQPVSAGDALAPRAKLKAHTAKRGTSYPQAHRVRRQRHTAPRPPATQSQPSTPAPSSTAPQPEIQPAPQPSQPGESPSAEDGEPSGPDD